MEAATRSPKFSGRDLAVGWSALIAAVLAVIAWSACCVLPMALSVAGPGLASTGFIKGQRGWLTLGAAILLAGRWWMARRRRRACAIDAGCGPPSQLTLALLWVASLLVLAAAIWRSITEPWAPTIVRSARR